MNHQLCIWILGIPFLHSTFTWECLFLGVNVVCDDLIMFAFTMFCSLLGNSFYWNGFLMKAQGKESRGKASWESLRAEAL